MTEEMILVSFGLMVRSYFNNNSVIRFLFIRSSGFGLMASSLLNWFRFYSFTLNFGGFFQDKLVELAAVSFLHSAWVWLDRIVLGADGTGLGTTFIA